MKKILSVVETAYRATIEEQDDTVLWLNHILKNAGGDVSLLLSGNAVNYAVKGQKATGSLAGAIHFRPPEMDQDLARMISKGIPVFLTQEDVAERGLMEAELIEGVQKVSRDNLPSLLSRYDQIFWW